MLLPYDMESDVQATVVIDGPADNVIEDLKRLRDRRLIRHAVLKTLIQKRAHGGRRVPDVFDLPAIMDGDASGALEQLDRLVDQRLIDEDLERRLEAAIKDLQELTRP